MIQAVLGHYPVKIITPLFLVHAQFEPMGPVVNFMNDAARTTVAFSEATLYDLHGKLEPSTHPLVVFKKRDICCLYVDDARGRASIQLLQRTINIIVHVPNLICRGEVHVGAETRQADILDSLIGQYLVLTNVAVFPTVHLPADFPSRPELILGHKDAIEGYYPE